LDLLEMIISDNIVFLLHISHNLTQREI